MGYLLAGYLCDPDGNVYHPWRAIPLRQIVFMFLLGMSIVPLMAFIAQAGLYRLVNLDQIQRILTADTLLGNYDLMSPVVSPITEEIFKVAPAIVFLSWSRRASWLLTLREQMIAEKNKLLKPRRVDE